MKKSFYEKYLERKNINTEYEIPKIRSPDIQYHIKVGDRIKSFIKFVIILTISILAVIGIITIIDYEMRERLHELLINNSIFIE